MSFYPVAARADQGPQLQVNIFSPIGGMAQQRFEEFWEKAQPLSQLYTCTVILDSERSFDGIGFLVTEDGATYVATREDRLIRALVGRDRLQVKLPGDTTPADYTFKSLEENNPRFAGVYGEVVAKYGTGARVVLELTRSEQTA
jgi:hypothetical protein